MLVQDNSLIYREYIPQQTWGGIAIETGIITGVIFVDATRI